MKIINIIFLALCFMLSFLFAKAQVDTIDISKQDLITSNLKSGLSQYLVYFENPKKKKIVGHSLWSREVNLKKLNGKDIIEIVQHWTSNDTLNNRYVYSISDAKTFAPIYHYTKSVRGVEAFDFMSTKVEGSDSVAYNVKRDFSVDLAKPTLNWELDLEIYNTLPFKKIGQRFIINFYHPGGKMSPAYYEYAVVGDEKISSSARAFIDCWKLKINYSDTDYAMFWIAKKSKEVLKMQECYKGNYRYKIKLATSVAPTKI